MTTIQIEKNDNRLNAVKFLTSAMDPKDGRFHKKYFKVEPSGHAVATDGHRLHWVSDLPLEEGFYQVHKNNKTSVLIEKVYELDNNEGSFPDYPGFLEIPEGSKEFNLVCQESNVSSAYTNVIRAMTDTTLEFKFVNDICKTINDIVYCSVPEPGETTNRPVHFTLNGFHAVVMPKTC